MHTNTLKDRVNKLDQYMKRIVPFGFSGALLLAKGEEILLNQGYGLANRSQGTPNDSLTYFDIGSITKQFTAAAIMKLEMDGRLTTTDPISKHLHFAPNDKEQITLHHLLTHTSGIRDSCGDDYEALDKQPAVQRILTQPLYSAPGESYVYCNDGYTLLAAIIEEITKEPYEQYVHEHLFQPAGMKSTGYRIPKWKEDKVSNGYVDGEDRGNPIQKDYPYWNLMGNGGMLSTTNDFFQWHRALLGENILSESAKAKLYTPLLRNYAYGWCVYDTPQGKLIEHDGASTYGTSAYFLRYIDQDIVIVLFTNTAFKQSSVSKIVSDKIVNLVFGGHVHYPPEIDEMIEPPGHLEMVREVTLPSGGAVQLKEKNQIIQVSTYDQDALKYLVWESYDEEYVNRLIQISESVANEMIEDQFELLEQLYQPVEEEFEKRKATIQHYLQRLKLVHAENKEIKHFGTVPSKIKKGTIEVRIELLTDASSAYLVIFWNGDYITYLGFTGVKLLEVINCVQVDGMLYGYHLANEKSFTIPVGREQKSSS